MIAREVPVQDVLRVVLQSGTQNLEEVVVTAIGMKKQEKALGYAASTVKSEDLNAAKSGSVMSGLTGKLRRQCALEKIADDEARTVGVR